MVPLLTFSISEPAPETAGIPNPRAKIAVWEVAEPRAVQNPTPVICPA